MLRRVSQGLFGLMLFMLLVSHASANGGLFTWLPIPLPTAVSGLNWQIGLFSLLPILVGLLWLVGLQTNLREVFDKANPVAGTSRRFRFGKTAVTLPLALFSLLILSQLTLDMIHYAALLGLCWFIYLFLLNNPNWQQKNLWMILAIVLLVQGSVGVAQFVTQREVGLAWLGEPTLNLLVKGISIAQRGDQNWLRAYGINSHPNQLGLLLMALCLLIWPSRHLAQGWRRWLFWLGLAAGVAGLLVSLSRSAWLGLALGGMVYWLHRTAAGRLSRRELLLPLAMLAAGVLLFTLAYGDVLAGRLFALDSPLESRSLWERQRDAGLALQLIGKRPLQGVGLGEYVAAATTLDDAAVIVHNIPLLIGAELGLFGLAIWLFWWLWPLWRYGRSPAHQSGTAVWLALIFVALVQPEPALFLPKGAVLWGLAAAQWHYPAKVVKTNQRVRRKNEPQRRKNLMSPREKTLRSLRLLSETLRPLFLQRSTL